MLNNGAGDIQTRPAAVSKVKSDVDVFQPLAPGMHASLARPSMWLQQQTHHD